MEKREVDFLELVAAFNANKRLIIGGTLLICALAALLSLLIPNEYEAVVQLLPPKEQRKGLGFADLLSALPIPSLRLGEKGTPADIYVAILKSPTVRRRMVEQFDLMRLYDKDTMVETIETLEKKTTVKKSEEGTIMIAVLDRDPQRAAEMANHYVALLDSTNQHLTRTTALNRLDFIDRLSNEENEKLEQYMEVLQKFQAEHNAISIEEQAKAVIRAAAEMQVAAMEMEIKRIGLLASGFSPTHPEVQRAQKEIEVRQQALAFLRDGGNGKMQSDGTPVSAPRELNLAMEENLFLPLRQIPQVAQEYANIEKDVLVQAALMKLLLQQKAEAFIEANNTTSTVQPLDVAVPPEKKARPQRFLIVFISGILSLFASTCYVVISTHARALKARWQERYSG
jgi:uncharacterized protein involved in exopolysaccharide biosynthesis